MFNQRAYDASRRGDFDYNIIRLTPLVREFSEIWGGLAHDDDRTWDKTVRSDADGVFARLLS